ncbi:bifunctional [glutamine synthetase] adenylyltransferase/[glutamine synthetase]-adenylyl-L-tyrosine phosphorylase [Arthrobacter bussei]|uniref:Bifunctional [glutamine synthetase] adenylyltransferase/[glutamine synthetase]-adenylyl-L-tyrosine phosphorylase n=1 Tax=Arthrobacter bussei TaxID=2594179 RepID=A0A7X1TNU1_9MICC|nr:bifunctional [glutamine synthetase] adenylyltransferase/[glutamine synthetase]-adenylyl-L-tyrosine phosphorylase [Arthrobacter bussei]MPY11112.1 bifunctional [glutamine synthetase] adenylyltransferase/[glutamine synthetase]-adenylyl-L-tyrosine phosphorylase [Arthrobacter bussei]
MSLNRKLISYGFADLEKSRRFLDAPELQGLNDDALFAGLAVAANPDLALQSFVRLLAARRAPVEATFSDEGRRSALFRLLGASEALGEFLMRHPEHLDVVVPGPAAPRVVEAADLRTVLLQAVQADPGEDNPVAGVTGVDAHRALRIAYRRQLTDLAVRDLGHCAPVDYLPVVARELADLAAAALEASLAVARAELGEVYGSDVVRRVRLAVIAMGKCGARELNYISDVDVVYVVEGDDLDDATLTRIGTGLASGMSRGVYSPGPEPALWEVDANLRPEGKDGQLVRTLESHVSYYRRWAKTWEFQALLKARAVAGDLELGRRYEEAIAPFVWASSQREGFVEAVRAMRRRVTDNIPREEEARQLKLGPGGLRDVEFTVQLLQLVHGRLDDSLRVRDTVSAIAALSAAGYIGRSDALDLDDAYRYLRVLEHRIQLVQMRRTHLMPEDETALRSLARSSEGCMVTVRPSAQSLHEKWQRTRRLVKRLHEAIFYRPLLNNAATLRPEDVQLTAEAAQARLAALGYQDPRGAMRHIEALTGGLRRRAMLQKQLLPILLAWFADGVDPDAGLLGFRRLSESLGESHWYLGMLRDSNAAAERLCAVLSSSRFITDLLEVSPESTQWLGSDSALVPDTFEAQWQEIQSKMSRHPEPGEAIRLIRLIRRRELLRIAIADSSSLLTQAQVGEALADADRAAVLGALHVAEKELTARGEPRLTDVVVMAMGRQGGREITYGSDADVIYVHRPLEGADAAAAQRQAEGIVARLAALLTQPCRPPVLAERVLEIDAALRPEGKQGAMVRSIDSYREYYRRWSLVWEAQALLRARPLAGDDGLAAEFVALIDPVRYPQDLGEMEVREIRRVKARVEAERLPRGADPSRHLKLGRGALSDVEWLVQLLQLQHAHAVPGLRVQSTLAALDVIAAEGLLPADDVDTLRAGWNLATRIRAANVIWSGRGSDLLPSPRRDLEAVARWCGYGPGSGSDLEEDYLRMTRRSRAIFERHFYGY